jgi:hypothetical protein
MELKKIGILSAGKIAGLFGIIYGLIMGIFYSFVYSKSSTLAALGQQIPAVITTLGYASIIVMPIILGVAYFVAGIVGALIYNLLARWVGGVKLEFKEEKKK